MARVPAQMAMSVMSRRIGLTSTSLDASFGEVPLSVTPLADHYLTVFGVVTLARSPVCCVVVLW